MPSILFIHTNFPAQFGFLGTRLARAGWDVAYATRRQDAASSAMRIIRFPEGRGVTEGIHPYLANSEQAVITGQQAARVLIAEREKGYRPDIVMAHSGWGAGLFVPDIFPEAVFIPYVEWWYTYPPVDSAYDGDFTPGADVQLRQRIRNAPLLLDLAAGDFCLCPTGFQAAQFPRRFDPVIRVIHDGVDTDLHAPAETRPGRIGDLDLAAMPEIVTYATRGMEPQRGFPQFMRALAALQAARPGLHAIVVGQDRVAYGRQLPEGETWKSRMLAECDLDLSRVHFTGLLSRADYVRALQASDVHVYLTVPFVLSWSMLEAMSAGCTIVGADVAPVKEFITSGSEGILVDFRDPARVVEAVTGVLDDRAAAARMGAAARAAILGRCDLETVFAAKKAMLEDALGPRLAFA